MKYGKTMIEPLKFYVLLIEDHRDEVRVFIFEEKQEAICAAINFLIRDFSYKEENTTVLSLPMINDGWVYHYQYNDYGDSVRVLEKTLNEFM